MASKLTTENMEYIIRTIPRMNLDKNKGICEFYMDGDMSIGVSYEDLKQYQGVVFKDVYIFNIFLGDEYINIEGEYQWKDNQFEALEALEDQTLDIIKILTAEWNRLVDVT